MDTGLSPILNLVFLGIPSHRFFQVFMGTQQDILDIKKILQRQDYINENMIPMLSLKNTIQKKEHVIISQNMEILDIVMQQRRKIQALEFECLNLKSRTKKYHQMHLDYIIKS